MADIPEILTELAYYAHGCDNYGDGTAREQIETAIANATEQIKAQQRERVGKAKSVSIFIKSVRGMMHALALDRPDMELIGDYGMLGIHNIRAVNESLAALKELEAEGE